MTTFTRARLSNAATAAIVAVVLGGGCDSDNGPTPTLTELTLNAASAVGGTAVQGTVTLSANAPSGGAVVTLSSNNAAATVPGSVTVPSGSTSASFTVNTTAVTATTPVTISGTFGATRTATLNVTPPALAAAFTVTSGTGVANLCILNVGGQTLDCTFNGSQSVGAVSWQWRYSIATNEILAPPTPSNVATLATPSTNGCGLFQGQTGGGPATLLQMVVRLIVRNAAGNTAESVNNNVSVQPRAGACGF
jgi:hypothetical protein